MEPWGLWLDDLRDPDVEKWAGLCPDGRVVWVKTAAEALALLGSDGLRWASLDHDLGDGPTGRVVANMIEEMAHTGALPEPIGLYCHSANPVGRQAIQAAFNGAWRAWGLWALGNPPSDKRKVQ